MAERKVKSPDPREDREKQRVEGVIKDSKLNTPNFQQGETGNKSRPRLSPRERERANHRGICERD